MGVSVQPLPSPIGAPALTLLLFPVGCLSPTAHGDNHTPHTTHHTHTRSNFPLPPCPVRRRW